MTQNSKLSFSSSAAEFIEGAMLSLLKWKSYSGNLGDILNQFTYVDQMEVLKVFNS